MVNERYLEAISELNEFSKKHKKDTNNPFIRFLQIINASNSKFKLTNKL